MNREELDDLVDQWHEGVAGPLHEYLGMTNYEYVIWTEFDILPGEPITLEKFLALRSDAYRWANDADNYLEENKRYKEAVREIKDLLSDSMLGHEGWIHSGDVAQILDVNNV